MYIDNDSWTRITPEEVLNVLRLSAALKASWEKDTCYPGDVQKWTKKIPSVGQCAVTSLVVQDHLSGVIHRNTEFHHYWNQLSSGGLVDFTHDQFAVKHAIPTQGTVERNRLLKGKSAERAMTKQRYKVLRGRVSERLRSISPTVVLLSSNAQAEYIHDIIEVMGTPQGTVHHFRYMLRYVDNALRKLIPVAGKDQFDYLSGMEAMIVYLKQERKSPGVYVWNDTMPIRMARLRRCYKTAEADESVAHFFFEVRESLLKNDIFHKGLTSILGTSFGKAYASLTYEDTANIAKRHQGTEVFETQCKQIGEVGFAYKSENVTVNYESPLFILFEGLYKKPFWGEDEVVRPKYDYLVPKSYYLLLEGTSYRFRFRTFSLEYNKPYKIRLRMKEALFTTPDEYSLAVKSAYDSECWEVTPSFIEQNSLGHMTLDIKSIELDEKGAEPARLDWEIHTIYKVKRRLFVRFLDILGELLFVLGPVYLAITKFYENAASKPSIITQWPYVLSCIYLVYFLVKLVRSIVSGK